VEIEALDVPCEGEPQRLQLLVNGRIQGTVPSRKQKLNGDVNAYQEIEKRVYVVIASTLLWLWRDAGVLKKRNAWGVLRAVRPEAVAAAAAAPTPSCSQGSR
jgi:hypothetical protein